MCNQLYSTEAALSNTSTVPSVRVLHSHHLALAHPWLRYPCVSVMLWYISESLRGFPAELNIPFS